MTQAQKPRRSLGKILLNTAIGLVISTIVGAILAALIWWLFPLVNPLVSQMITSFELPYSEWILKAAWFGFSFVGGMLLTMMFNLPIQWIRGRLQRRRLARSA
jgi:hypothetical protein